MKVFQVGERVLVEGVIVSVGIVNGLNISIKDGELPPIGTFYFSNVAGIRECPPTCPECGTDMRRWGQIIRCPNCLSNSGKS